MQKLVNKQLKITEFIVIYIVYIIRLQEQYNELKNDRDFLEMQLQAEIHNSDRLNRDVQSLLSKNKMLEHIDNLKNQHIEELRDKLDRSQRQRYRKF